MPFIRPYESTSRLNPDEFSALASAQEGAGRELRAAGFRDAGKLEQEGRRKVSRIYQKADQTQQYLNLAGKTIRTVGGLIEKHRQQSDVTRLSSEFPKIEADLAVKWQETLAKADPNSTDTLDKFLSEVVEPALGPLGENLGSAAGKEMYGRMAANLRGSMFVKGSSDISELKGLNAVNTLKGSVNNRSQIVRRDPTQFQNQMAQLETELNNYTQVFGLTAENRLRLDSELKKSLAEAAILGKIDINPTAAKAELEGKDFSKHFDAEEITRFKRQADILVEARENDRKAAQTEYEKARKEAATRQINQIVAGFTTNEDGRVVVPQNYNETLLRTMEQFSDVPGFSSQVFSAMAAGRAIVNSASTDEKVITNQNVFKALHDRINSAGEDELDTVATEIADATALKHINSKDYSLLNNLLSQRDTVEKAHMKTLNSLVNRFESVLSGRDSLTGLTTPGMEQNFYDFSFDTIKLYNELRKRGETPEEILDPNNKKFILNRIDINRYKQPRDFGRFTDADRERMDAILDEKPETIPDDILGGVE